MLYALAVTWLFGFALGHEHHMDQIPEGSVVSPEPLDSILWLHIACMTVAFGLLFPAGMVLGLTKSRLHVPVQALGICLTVVGYFLAHSHGGRQFGPTAHAAFANVVLFFLLGQAALGIYLKLHWANGIHLRIRRVAVLMHGIMGRGFPIVSWVQMLLGAIAALGFCSGDHLGQCLAHEIMGSSFIAYGLIMLIMLAFGRKFLQKINKSQEFLDSAVIGAWGLVNTFTEHHGGPWSHKDLQHTALGIIWFCAGILGVLLSFRNGRPKRNFVPGAVIVLTGVAMSSHAQSLELSTKVHATFGYTLIAAGVTRIIEVSIILKDRAYLKEINSFQYLPPFLLVSSGLLFMAATEEQMNLLASLGFDPNSYTLAIYSVAFLLFAFAQSLILLYQNSGHNLEGAPSGFQTLFSNRRAENSQGRRGLGDRHSVELDALLDSDEETEVNGLGMNSKEGRHAENNGP